MITKEGNDSVLSTRFTIDIKRVQAALEGMGAEHAEPGATGRWFTEYTITGSDLKVPLIMNDGDTLNLQDDGIPYQIVVLFGSELEEYLDKARREGFKAGQLAMRERSQ